MFAIMDGNYANRLSIIALNESLDLGSNSSILSDQSSSLHKKSIKAVLYKIVDWTTVNYRPCEFEITYVKMSSADDAGTDENANYAIRM